MKLREYQSKALDEVLFKLRRLRICYLAGEVRTGKTLVAIFAAYNYLNNPENKAVLFVTKKKAIKSIESDLVASSLVFRQFDIINYEQLNKIDRLYHLVIFDEAHTLGAFPKPSLRTALAAQKSAGTPTIFLSGTPTPESFSQLYHQFWVTGSLSPWAGYKNFYQWAKQFVTIKQKYIRMGLTIQDYSNAKPEVVATFNQYKVTMTQEDAEFNCDVVEKVHELTLPDNCLQLIKTLRKDKLSESARIVADSGAKLMSAIHQISSGTYIETKTEFTDPTIRNVLSNFKADYIKKTFKGKLAIFYVYIAEGILLRNYFKNHTDNPEEFNQSSNKVFICQIQSGKEGINLSTADHLIFYNIAYSAVAYWQGRARTQELNGGDKLCHWLFSDKGIEKKIFNVVATKKSFTTRHFNINDYE